MSPVLAFGSVTASPIEYGRSDAVPLMAQGLIDKDLLLPV